MGSKLSCLCWFPESDRTELSVDSAKTTLVLAFLKAAINLEAENYCVDLNKLVEPQNYVIKLRVRSVVLLLYKVDQLLYYHVSRIF